MYVQLARSAAAGVIDDYTTEALILHCLAHLRKGRAVWMTRYLAQQWSIAPGSTRNALCKLKRRGVIERIGYGVYQLASADHAANEADALTTTLHELVKG